MADPEYTPFPESELESLAKDYALGAANMRPGGSLPDLWSSRAKMLRDAIACHAALRERCLLAEMDRNQLQLKLEAKSAA